jgi:uncharacterized beta-barrel protein YwiB (DUF1934 family)
MTRKHLKNMESPVQAIEASADKAKYYCEFCGKSFTRKDNLIRHNSNHCKKTEISINLQNQIDDLRNEIENGKDAFKGVLEEKDKYINYLKEQNKNMNQTTFQIIQNNIITMSPLKFLNTFCNNNPTLREVSETIREMEISKEDFKLLQEGIEHNNKNILGAEIDNLMKKANKLIISENGINGGVCENVLFINDGSCRRFITKGDPGWDYYKNDDLLDAITCGLIESSISQYKNGTLMNKRERDTVNKVIKGRNDYNMNKEEIVKSITLEPLD